MREAAVKGSEKQPRKTGSPRSARDDGVEVSMVVDSDISYLHMKNTLFIAALITAMPVCALATDNLSGAMVKYMEFLTEEDKIISKNIANIDTPNYIPKRLSQNQTDVNSMSMATTHEMHIPLDDSSQYSISNEKVQEYKPNGNRVAVEHELIKKNANSMELQQALYLYNKAKSLVNAAITGGGK